MKKSFLGLMFAAALVLSSCGADQKVVDQFADDMCKTMETYNPDDPMSALSLLESMTKIMEKKEYEGVTESQLKTAMEKKCPEGFKKFEDLKKMGK